MIKLVSAALVLLTLVGCGTNNAIGPTLSGNKTSDIVSSRSAAFAETLYTTASLEQLKSFESAVSPADNGKKFKSTGYIWIEGGAEASDWVGRSARLCDTASFPKLHPYIAFNVQPLFFARIRSDAFFDKLGQHGEKVTVYYTLRGSKKMEDRFEIHASKHQDGRLVIF